MAGEPAGDGWVGELADELNDLNLLPREHSKWYHEARDFSQMSDADAEAVALRKRRELLIAIITKYAPKAHRVGPSREFLLWAAKAEDIYGPPTIGHHLMGD